jgi:TusA-related sulfurtransferase
MTDSENLAIENSTATLDLRGLRCPIPAIRAQRYIQENMTIRQFIILLTDRSALKDIPNAISSSGWTVVKVEETTVMATLVWRLHLAARH